MAKSQSRFPATILISKESSRVLPDKRRHSISQLTIRYGSSGHKQWPTGRRWVQLHWM